MKIKLIIYNCMILLFASRSLVSQDLELGLVINYNFSNNYLDSSINGFDGENVGTELVNDRFDNSNSAIYFDGNDLVKLPFDQKLQPDFPFSFSIWTKMDETPMFTPNPLLTFGLSIDQYSGFFAGINSSSSTSFAIHYSDFSGATGPNNRRSRRALNIIKPGKWYHLVAVYRNPQELDIYYNGCLQNTVSSGNCSYNINYSNDPSVLGTIDIAASTPDFFKGTMDDFYLWDRVITEEEIGLLYNEFHSEEITNINHLGCTGDNYEIIVDGIKYDELNPNGTIILEACDGCDSIVNVNLEFADSLEGSESYEGCEGDNYSVVVNSVIYNEQNPSGEEIFMSSTGCDSIVTVNLEFADSLEGSELYEGCEGDNYSVVVNSVIYNEQNPSGEEIFMSSTGCDSIVTVSLLFADSLEGSELYEGCEGDNYSVIVNGVIYNEQNPSGEEILVSSVGCDSIVSVNLLFANTLEGSELYEGCEGDNYSVVVNGVIYNEQNPVGEELLVSSIDCDSIVNIDLSYQEVFEDLFNYIGCVDDGFEVVIGGEIFNEQNPSGEIIIESSFDCDTLVFIDLQFSANSEFDFSYSGVDGDSYEILINDVIYNQQNPVGQEILESSNGCDSLVNIFLEFASKPDCNIYFPNIISPNNDGFNDIFTIYYEEDLNVEILEFLIFDRWGNRLYSDKSYPFWNGVFNNKKVVSGVYSYLIKVKTDCFIEQFTGDIQVVN